jgi:hypothetical protein
MFVYNEKMLNAPTLLLLLEIVYVSCQHHLGVAVNCHVGWRLTLGPIWAYTEQLWVIGCYWVLDTEAS